MSPSRSVGFFKSASETARLAAFVGFQRKFGCDEDQAAHATIALHPLNDPPTSRHFSKRARKLSRWFARASRKAASADELDALATLTIATYLGLAAEYEEDGYVDYYAKVLKSATQRSEAERLSLQERFGFPSV